MKILDYYLFIAHRFVAMVNLTPEKEIVSRVKIYIAMMFCFVNMLFYFAFYMAGISLKLYPFNKAAVFVSVLGIFGLTLYFVFNRYKDGRYSIVIESLDKRYSYTKATLGMFFLVITFIPAFCFWGGTLLLRKILY